MGDRPVPDGVRDDYVLGLVEAYLTNGNGVARNAEPVYRQLLEQFSRQEAEAALLSFTNTTIAGKLQMRVPKEKFGQLLELI